MWFFVEGVERAERKEKKPVSTITNLDQLLADIGVPKLSATVTKGDKIKKPKNPKARASAGASGAAPINGLPLTGMALPPPPPPVAKKRKAEGDAKGKKGADKGPKIKLGKAGKKDGAKQEPGSRGMGIRHDFIFVVPQIFLKN